MSPVPHGTLTGYSCRGCRCDACKDASHNYYLQRILHRGPRLIDKTGTRRRVQALMRIGWTRAEIATRVGMTPGGLSRLLDPSWPTVTVRNAAKVAAVYDELCMTPGPSTCTAGHAKARGYAPPLAWDDIDDPEEQPDPGYDGTTHRLHIDDLEHLLNTDAWTWPGITRRTGFTRNTIEVACTRAGRKDLLHRLSTNTSGIAA